MNNAATNQQAIHSQGLGGGTSKIAPVRARKEANSITRLNTCQFILSIEADRLDQSGQRIQAHLPAVQLADHILSRGIPSSI